MAEYIPIEIVKKLAQDGKSEIEIISELRRRGFSNVQINKALNEALKEEIGKEEKRPYVGGEDRGNRIERHPRLSMKPVKKEPIEIGMPEQLKPLEIPGEEIPDVSNEKIGKMPEEIRVTKKLRPVEISSGKPKPREIQAPSSMEIEWDALVEAVVEERWKKFEEKLLKLSEEDKRIEQSVEELKEDFLSKLKNYDDLKKEFTSKLKEIDESISGVEIKIGSLEKVIRGFIQKKK